MINDLAKPPLDVNTSENGNTVYGDINIRNSQITIPPNAPPHYFVVLLSYLDSRNRHRYEQEFYYFWTGSDSTEFPMHFRDANYAQREAVQAYMKERKLRVA